MKYTLCAVYHAPSSSGGKVWALPTNSVKTQLTFSGTLKRYRDGTVTVNHLSKQKTVYDEVKRKESMGYTLLEDVWINEFGQVSTTNPEQQPASGLERMPEQPKAPLSTIKIVGDGVFNF
jgi:hypothetical protein